MERDLRSMQPTASLPSSNRCGGDAPASAATRSIRRIFVDLLWNAEHDLNETQAWLTRKWSEEDTDSVGAASEAE